jgi:hypothetical protein
MRCPHCTIDFHEDWVADSDPKKAIPLRLRETIDAIRNFGNFSAHPINDKTALQIIDVEPHEADWYLKS